jgi:hypothetical protein
MVKTRFGVFARFLTREQVFVRESRVSLGGRSFAVKIGQWTASNKPDILCSTPFIKISLFFRDFS